MEKGTILKQNGGQSSLSGLLLMLLFLAGLQPALSGDGKQTNLNEDNAFSGTPSVWIDGPKFIAVGVPSSVECFTTCTNCTYSMSVDGQKEPGQGNLLLFTVISWVPMISVGCTVTSEDTKQNATALSDFIVSAGPFNVTISGPHLVNPSVSHTYSCRAYCQPSCTYAWKLDSGTWINGQGNEITVAPFNSNSSKLLICKASNILSGLFASAVQELQPIAFSGTPSVWIDGPKFIAVGVPSSVECFTTCTNCTYSMSVDGQKEPGQGNLLLFTVISWVPMISVGCTVTSEDTKQNTTALSDFIVSAGPFNVTISGPHLVNPSVSHTYSCRAYCQPSCTYAWKLDSGTWINGQGNVITVAPFNSNSSKLLICKANNTLSGLFASAVQELQPIAGPSDIQIRGPNIMKLEKAYGFVCLARCVPSCRYVSSVDGHTVRGNAVDVTVDHPRKSVTIKCEARNTASRKTAVALKTVQIQGDRGLSARPEAASAALLLAVMVSAGVSL